jgi:hypothetical protein
LAITLENYILWLVEEVGLEATNGQIDRIEPALTEDELADLLHVPLHVLARMRRRGEGPTYVMCAGFIRYPAQSVRTFLAQAGSRLSIRP